MLILLAFFLSTGTGLFCLMLMVLRRPLLQDFLCEQSESQEPQEVCPPAAVILCVRGADPTLPGCLDGLLTQDYPEYQIHVVMDDESDPAAVLIEEAIARHPHVRVQVHVLRDRDVRRGLKVSAILHALGVIPQRVSVIAFLDADAEPQRDWLTRLVTPLQLPEIGATTGSRWFEPEAGNSGSHIRAKWNLYAVVLMRYFNIAWGGSFAIRRDALETSTLLSRWSESICEDTCVGDALSSAGYRVQLVPEVAMVNRERTNLSGCWRFMVRQLVFTRMHSRSWMGILTFGLMFTCLAALVPGATVVSLVTGDWTAFWLLATSWLMLHISVARTENILAALAQQHTRQDAQCRLPSAASFGSVLRNHFHQAVCVMMSGFAIVQAARTRQLTWRGITYRLHRSRVTLVEYVPFPAVSPSETNLRGMSI